MNTFFNFLILKFITLIPISIVRKFSGRYVAGDNAQTAINVVKTINQKGFSATIDILGEHVSTSKKATQITNNYLQLYSDLSDNNLDCNISVKPSHIGLDISENVFIKNANRLLAQAKLYNNFLRIDMESSEVTDQTLQYITSNSDDAKNLGTVFQAYLHRTMNDIQNLTSTNVNYRLCKGIYKESEHIAIQDRKAINDNFIAILKQGFTLGHYIGIATHDLDLLKDVYALIDSENIPNNQFEFQVLYGVPMSGWLEKHLENNYKVRVYVPFGPEWYDYSIRRLQENPNIAQYVLSNLFRK
jgi:proline dehydrogenase